MGNIIHVLVEVTGTTFPRKFAKALVTLAGILCQINARSKHTSRRAACPFHAKEVSGYALSRFWICAVKQIVLIDLLSSATTCTNTASSWPDARRLKVKTKKINLRLQENDRHRFRTRFECHSKYWIPLEIASELFSFHTIAPLHILKIPESLGTRSDLGNFWASIILKEINSITGPHRERSARSRSFHLQAVLIAWIPCVCPMILHPQYIGHTTANRHCRGTMDQTPISAEVRKPGIRHELLNFGDSIGIWKNLDPILGVKLEKNGRVSSSFRSKTKTKKAKMSYDVLIPIFFLILNLVTTLIHISCCVSQNKTKKAANQQHPKCFVKSSMLLNWEKRSIFGGPVQWYFHHGINHQF